MVIDGASSLGCAEEYLDLFSSVTVIRLLLKAHERESEDRTWKVVRKSETKLSKRSAQNL